MKRLSLNRSIERDCVKTLTVMPLWLHTILYPLLFSHECVISTLYVHLPTELAT